MLELYSEMGITSEQAPETLPSNGHPVSSTATVADAVEAKLAEKLAGTVYDSVRMFTRTCFCKLTTLGNAQ